MLINIDVSGLEWVTINWFSQDVIGCQEIKAGVDQHSNNQSRFGLPTRTIAKIFVFRLIYGGTSYSYANDPDFMDVSTSTKFWDHVIDAFYSKYSGIAKQHTLWMQEATRTGKLVMPTGRVFEYKPYPTKWGEMKWPRTTILNYPVQGTGADIVSIFRVSLMRRLRAGPHWGDIKLRSTVHDSVVLDTRSIHLGWIVDCVESTFRDLPMNFEKVFGVPFNLPLSGEISYGPNLRDLTLVK